MTAPAAACSALSRATDEPMAGTAPTARAWLVIEQPGHWGPKALAESSLDPASAHALNSMAEHGIRVLLARHPLRAQRRDDATRHAWLGCVLPGHERALHSRVALADLPGMLAALDPVAIAAGDLTSWHGEQSPPVVFACTHGSRDACCAAIGRPVLSQAWKALDDPLSLWECSHIGGHRFAPTALALPSGAVLGRATAEDLVAAVSGSVSAPALRGLSGLEPRHQAAHATWATIRPRGQVPARIVDVSDTVMEIYDAEGSRSVIEVLPTSATPRVESCGAEAVLGTSWTTRVLD